MKKALNLIIILAYSFVINAQNINSEMRMPIKKGTPSKAISSFSIKGISPYTAFLVNDLNLKEKSNNTIIDDSSFIKKYNLINVSNVLYANSFLYISENYDEQELLDLGFLPGSKSGEIITGLVPIDRISEIANCQSVKHLEIGEPVKVLMDEARASTWVDDVHAGTNLCKGYFGKDVVVGIIDGGFDYTHPNFYDATGTNNYRIKRVWEQNSNGTPPSGYSYGRELKTQTAILNAQTDDYSSHGTHVAGIAAGANSSYTGVAPQSDLILVSYGSQNTSIIDGISYIMNYAASVGKPCVINMSLGTHFGPHDGTSTFDEFCDGIVGPGKLLVGAAGNEGSDPLHLGKTFSGNDTLIYSLVNFPGTSNGTNGSTFIDIWGEQNQNFWVSVNIYNSNTNSIENWTPYISVTSNSSNSYTLNDNDTFSPDECIINITKEINQENGKPHISLHIDNTDQDDDYRWVMIEVVGSNTKMDMWAVSNNAYFTNGGFNNPFVSGSTNSTVGEIGGTGKNIISVGAYTSKNSYTSFNGSNQSTGSAYGDIASFSSKGPTADGRTKPDITAPGNVIVSSVNSFDTDYTSTSNEVVTGLSNGSKDWWFASMQGTSMASPMVTGILALWLEAYPNLTPDQAKTLLKDNAFIDSYTGTISSSGNNTWGWGKVDAHYGLLDLISKIPTKPIITPTTNISLCQGESSTLSAPNGFSNYQWYPSGSSQNINVSSSNNYSVRVTNSEGYISPWSDTRTVTVNSNPSIPTISLNGNVLSSSSNSGNQWYLDGVLIAGATSQSINVNQSGNYHVVVTNSSNCSTESSGINMNLSGIDVIEGDDLVSVYPNPNNGSFNLSFTNAYNQAKVNLTNSIGQTIFSDVITSKDYIIEGLSNGVYLLIIELENEVISKKVVVQSN